MEDINLNNVKGMEESKAKASFFDLLKTGEMNPTWGGMLLIAALAIYDAYRNNHSERK